MAFQLNLVLSCVLQGLRRATRPSKSLGRVGVGVRGDRVHVDVFFVVGRSRSLAAGVNRSFSGDASSSRFHVGVLFVLGDRFLVFGDSRLLVVGGSRFIVEEGFDDLVDTQSGFDGSEDLRIRVGDRFEGICAALELLSFGAQRFDQALAILDLCLELLVDSFVNDLLSETDDVLSLI